MYLAVILLRDLGWPGFLAFAIPNVIGAAAFGYVLASGARSEALIAGHRPALRWFSITAVAYHGYFAAFLVTILSPGSPAPQTSTALFVLAAAIASRKEQSPSLLSSSVVSLTVIVAAA